MSSLDYSSESTEAESDRCEEFGTKHIEKEEKSSLGNRGIAVGLLIIRISQQWLYTASL